MHTVQNCEISSGASCGGIDRSHWVLQHKDVQMCCKTHLAWLCPDPDIPCEACTKADISAWASDENSVQSTVYYVDWDLRKCVESCDPSPNAPHCQGAPKSWQVPHSDLATCCQVHHLNCPDHDFPCEACTDVPILG